MTLRWSQCQCLRRISASLCQQKYQHNDIGLSSTSWTWALYNHPFGCAISPEPLRVIVIVVVVFVGVVGGSEFIVPQVHSEYRRRQLLVTSQLRIALWKRQWHFPERGLGPRERSVPRSEKKRRRIVYICEMILTFSRDKEQRHGPAFRLFRHDASLREAEASHTIRN